MSLEKTFVLKIIQSGDLLFLIKVLQLLPNKHNLGIYYCRIGICTQKYMLVLAKRSGDYIRQIFTRMKMHKTWLTQLLFLLLLRVTIIWKLI